SLETFLVIFTVFIELGAEQFECTDRGNEEKSRSICSHHDVEHPHPCRRVEHRSQRIDVDQFAVHQIEASRCVHEGVHCRDEHCGQRRTDDDGNVQKPVMPGIFKTVPCIQ